MSTIRELLESGQTFITYAVIVSAIVVLGLVAALGISLKNQSSLDQALVATQKSLAANHKATTQQLAVTESLLKDSQAQLEQTKQIVIKQDAYIQCLFSLATGTPYISNAQLKSCYAPLNTILTSPTPTASNGGSAPPISSRPNNGQGNGTGNNPNPQPQKTGVIQRIINTLVEGAL